MNFETCYSILTGLLPKFQDGGCILFHLVYNVRVIISVFEDSVRGNLNYLLSVIILSLFKKGMQRHSIVTFYNIGTKYVKVPKIYTKKIV